MDLETKLSVNSEVIYTEMDNGEAVLLHMGSTQYFSLNESGVVIWQSLEKGQTLGEAAVSLTDHFDVDLETAEGAVLGLAGELIEAGLLQ